MKDISRDDHKSIEDGVSALKQRVRELEKSVAKSRKTEEALWESEARFRFFLDNMADIAFMVDMNLQTTYVNPSIETVLGFTPEERKKQQVHEQLTPESLKFAFETMAEELEREKTGEADPDRSNTLVLDYYHKDGSIISLETCTQGIRDSEGILKGFYGLSRNVTERKRMEEELKDSEQRYRELSIIDDLTLLYNARHFYHQLKIEIEKANRYTQPVTLLMLDIDDFKAFNDTHGHVEGNNVLLRLGQVIKRCLRRSDSAYRYGGEEFTVILPMETVDKGVIIAERIRKTLKKETFPQSPNHESLVTVSIGVGQYRPQEELQVFVHRVDQLMYYGKKKGKDIVCSET